MILNLLILSSILPCADSLAVAPVERTGQIRLLSTPVRNPFCQVVEFKLDKSEELENKSE